MFHALNKENLKTIVDIELAKIRGRMRDRGLELIMNDEAKEFLIAKGYNPDYGARPLRRAIENMIENPLAEELLRGSFQGKDKVYVEVEGEDEDTKVQVHPRWPRTIPTRTGGRRRRLRPRDGKNA